MPISGFGLFQRLDDQGPGRAGFGVEGGRGEDLYISSRQVNALEIKQALLDIMGDVSINTTLKRLNRQLPLFHPMYPWLFANNVEVVGTAQRDADSTGGTTPTEAFLEGEPITDDYWVHARTILKVQFAPRPYALLSDGAISPASLPYTRIDGVPDSVPSGDSKEYLRFVDVETDPNPQRINATIGNSLAFYTAGGDPSGAPFPGFAWTVLPDGAFRITWFQVPYTLVSNFTHPMYTQIGMVNQTEFFGHPPGKLLYAYPKFRRYTPVVPAYETLPGSASFSAEKLCDVTFHFGYTTRSVTNAPTPANANWVLDGHNAQPWHKDKKFYAVASNQAAAANRAPGFLSMPMQLLFRVV